MAAASPQPQKPSGEPKIRGADRAASDLVRPGTLPQFGSVKLFWNLDVDLPSRARLRHVFVKGYDPVILKLADGRCFTVQMDSGGEHLTSARIDRSDCITEPERSDPWPPPKPRSGMHYLERSASLDAWTDPRSGSTFFVQAHHQDRPPVMSTSMRVAAMGALPSIDVPATELTLVGYIGGQLTIATVMVYLPEVTPNP